MSRHERRDRPVHEVTDKPPFFKLHVWKDAILAEKTAHAFLKAQPWFVRASKAFYSDGQTRVKVVVRYGTEKALIRAAIPTRINNIDVVVEEE